MIYLAWFCYLFTGGWLLFACYANFDYWRFERKQKGKNMLSKAKYNEMVANKTNYAVTKDQLTDLCCAVADKARSGDSFVIDHIEGFEECLQIPLTAPSTDEPWRSEFCTVSENGLRVMYVSPVGANGSRAAVFLDDRGRYNSFDHANRYLVPLKKERVAVERWAVVNEKGEPSGHFESESMAHGVASMLKEQTWVVKLTGEYER